MATQTERAQQAPRPLPWKKIAIGFIILALTTTSGFSILSIATKGEAGSVVAEELNSLTTKVKDLATIDDGYAPAISLNTNAIALSFTRPGNPEEVVHWGQVVTSFLLLSSRGNIDEAMEFVAPEAQPDLREFAEWVRRMQPDLPSLEFYGIVTLWDEENNTLIVFGRSVRSPNSDTGKGPYLMKNGNLLLEPTGPRGYFGFPGWKIIGWSL